MSEKIVSLNGGPVVQRKPNEACIDTLRELLEMAESGEIVGLAGAIMYGDGSSAYRISGTVDQYRIIGALECAKGQMVSDVLEGN